MSLKNFMGKSTALFAAMLVIHSNCYMFGLGLSKVIAQDIKEPNINLNLENVQYVQFNEEIKTDEPEGANTGENPEAEKQYNSGVAIKTKLQLSLEEQETQLPIKSSEFSVSMPILNGRLPEKAIVASSNTALTTGENNNQKINQNYDSNSGLLTVSYENKDTYLNYNKESKDEFEFIYIYPAQAYNGNEEVSLQYSVVAKMNFETENTSTTSEKAQGFELKEKDNKGSLLSFGVTRLENNIYKGFLYSNTENGNNYDTDYNTISTLCVLNSNNTNELVMEMKENKFLLNDDNNTEISSEGKLLYKSTQINKTEFDKILGQNGSIEIYENETLLATLKYIEVSENKSTVKKLAIIYSEDNIKILSPEETTAKVEYGDGVKNLTIKTTKPISEGYLNFKNENIIKGSESYTEDVSKLKSIKTTSIVANNTSEVELLLVEPQTKISVESSNVNFSTLQTSNTTLTIKLDTTNASTKLFNNPTITITLPEGLTGGNLSSPEIVNGNGLSIKNANAIKNVITIELEGKQTNYDLTNVSGGASIVMDIENIDFNDTLPTHTDKIEVTCLQNKEQVKATKEVNIISKAGLLILSNVTGFDNNEKIRSIDSSVNTVEISNEAEQKEIVQTINLVNNYNDKITNTQIIGKIGYINEELKSTFDLELAKKIEVENAKVYYSTNKDATYNDQSWTEEFTNQAKAYKIELEGSELASKEGKEIKVTLKIPANLGYNHESYIKTQVNYTSNQQNLNDSTTFGIVTPTNNLTVYSTANNSLITNEEGNTIPISVEITPIIKQAYVRSLQRVTYEIAVKNNGTEELKNIKLEDIIPDNAIYTYLKEIDDPVANYTQITKDEKIKNKTWNIENLDAGETATFEIMLTMADVTEEQEIINTAKLTCNNQEIFATNTLKLKPAKIQTNLTTDSENMIGLEYNAGDKVSYYIEVKNVCDETLKNVKVNFELPTTLSYINGGLGEGSFEEGYEISKQGNLNENIFGYTIDKLQKDETKVIRIDVTINELQEETSANITTISQINIENEVYESNIKTITTKQAKYTLNLTSNTNIDTVYKNGDEIVYTVKVSNIGSVSSSFVVESNIPEQLNVIKIEEIMDGELKKSKESTGKKMRWISSLSEGEELILKIYTNVDIAEEYEVTNTEVIYFTTLSYGSNKISSNNIKIIVQSDAIEDKDLEDDNIDGDIDPDENDNDNFVYDDNFDFVDDDIDDYIDDKDDDDIDDYIDDRGDDDIKGDIDNDDSGNNDVGDEEKDNRDENKDDNTLGENDDKDDDSIGGDDDGEDSGNNDNSGKERNENEDEDKGNNEKEKSLYEIKGSVWLDLNKDGKRDETETSQQNIQVSIVNATTGNYVTDKNGNKITTTTNSEGKYTFTNLEEGKYIVIFEFDTNKYTVTTYQKSGVAEEQNSDAILSTVTINGESKLMGITDTIDLKSNKENIDIGLIENAKFNLSLDKKITKITVVNKQGTQTYEYKNGHTAKVDLVAKYMAGSEVIVTYKFTITNEGEVTGYVNSLMDSLPSGLEFNSELNKDWYKDSDGNLYTTSLSGIAIKPGETSEIELVLNKTMTEENAGTFVNSAKLVKISNLENIAENETAIEDNESSAILIISIKTGSLILYLGITLMCLVIIGAGTYMINKKVIKKES